MIDLRSDTQTRPTPEMRAAIAAAEVGDEQKREDPTVNRLEELAAQLLGQEQAVFVPTATMANEIALRTLSEPGDEVIAEENSHIFLSELGGPAVHSGLMTRPLRCEAGRFTPEQLRETARAGDSTHTPATRIVSVENPHNASGGRVWPLEEIEAIVATARELGLRPHLDGARVMNAAVASGVPAAEIGRHFDTVTLCLSKGLGCPLGALVAGSEELMAKARRLKHLFGGAMRQAGTVAAGVFRAGELLWSEAIGLADVEEGVEATVDTQFPVASITKTFTAVSVMQLRAEGKLDLADPLKRHLPEASQHGSLTLAEMLAHASGLQREPPGEIWESLVFPDAAEVVARLPEAERVLPGGEAWHYSNLAYALLGQVVEPVSGTPFRQHVEDRLVQPLGLARAG